MKTQLHRSNFKSQRTLLQKLGVCLLSICLAPAWSGCKNEAGHINNIDPSGVYTLVSVDGKNLPCQLSHEGVTPTIKSGTFTITTDGHCRSLIAFSVPARGDMSREVKATYALRGSELTMQWEGAGTTMGVVSGKNFTMTNEGMIFAYRK